MGTDVGGAALGAAFNELFAAVRGVGVVQTIRAFGPHLKKIQNTLYKIEPIIRDWDKFNNLPDRNPEDMCPIKDLLNKGEGLVQDLLNKGKGLVQKCSSIHRFNMRKKYTHSNKLKAFNAELIGDFKLYIQLLDGRKNIEMLWDMKEIEAGVKQLIRSSQENGGALKSGFGAAGNLTVPDAPDFIVGSVVEASLKSASPMHHKSLVENSTAWRESNVQDGVHPLPRPPGAALPSHSPHNAQVTVKTESLPLKSQWQKGRLLGRGTFGSVYVASNRETGALCAMKEVELLPDDLKSAECMRQLEQEIKVLSRLKHQNIVQYYGSEIVEDRFYIYLEYVHPGSINKYVRDHCMAITESVVCNFTRHILSGLAYLHSQKTIHRDIKGANLLVDASGIVKLADFGMAKHLTGQKIDLSLKGSPYWMAPELLQAKMQKDNSSDHALAVDIWSLGCTIVEMLTGRPPWSEFEGPAAMFKAMKNSPSIPETLSSEGKDFLQCCFRRNPAERPSAAELLEHPFLQSSQQIDIQPHTRALSRKLTDLSHSPQEHVKHTVDKLPILPTAAQSTAFKAVIDSEGGRESHVETPDLTLVSRYSPRYP